MNFTFALKLCPNCIVVSALRFVARIFEDSFLCHQSSKSTIPKNASKKIFGGSQKFTKKVFYFNINRTNTKTIRKWLKNLLLVRFASQKITFNNFSAHCLSLNFLVSYEDYLLLFFLYRCKFCYFIISSYCQPFLLIWRVPLLTLITMYGKCFGISPVSIIFITLLLRCSPITYCGITCRRFNHFGITFSRNSHSRFY